MGFNELPVGRTDQKRRTEFKSSEDKACIDADALKRIAVEISEALDVDDVDPKTLIHRLKDPHLDLLLTALEGKLTREAEVHVPSESETVPQTPERLKPVKGQSYAIEDFLKRKAGGGYEIILDCTSGEGGDIHGIQKEFAVLDSERKNIERLFEPLPGLPANASLVEYKGLLFDVVANYLAHGGRFGVLQSGGGKIDSLFLEMSKLARSVAAAGISLNDQLIADFRRLKCEFDYFRHDLRSAERERSNNATSVKANYIALIHEIEQAVPPDPEYDKKVDSLRSRTFDDVINIDEETRSIITDVVTRSFQEAYLALGKFSDHLLAEAEGKMSPSQRSMRDFACTFLMDKRNFLRRIAGMPFEQYRSMFPEEINLAIALGLLSFHGNTGVFKETSKPELQNEVHSRLPSYNHPDTGVKARIDRLFRSKGETDPKRWWAGIISDFAYYDQDLLRVKYFIEAYFPENETYKEILQPIDNFIEILRIIGVEIVSENKIGQVLERDDLEPAPGRHEVLRSIKDGTLYMSHPGMMLMHHFVQLCPTVVQKVRSMLSSKGLTPSDISRLVLDIVRPGLKFHIQTPHNLFKVGAMYGRGDYGCWAECFWR